MENVKMQECTICGDEKTPGQIWFLIAESHWEDKLKVLEWRDELAKRHGVYAVCGAAASGGNGHPLDDDREP